MITFQSVFSGGGLADIGARQAGCTLVSAVEYEEKIAEVYRVNHGDHVYVSRVQNMDWHKTEPSDIVWASPVCKEFSVANNGGTESAEELSQAEAVASLIRIQQPKIFLLENVIQYRTSQSINIIRNALSECGYNFTEENVNSADFGVHQTRRRLILRAVRKGIVPPLAKTHVNPLRQPHGMESLFDEEYDAIPWNGWYNAVADLLDDLPTTQFAPWQLKRLEKMDYSFLSTKTGKPKAFLQMTGNTNMDNPIGTGVLTPCSPANTVCSNSERGARAFLYPVNGEGSLPLAAEGSSAVISANHGAMRHKAFLMDCQDSKLCGVTVRDATESTFTIGASQDRRPAIAWLEMGRVVSMNARCLARFQSVPDWYILPDKSGLSSTVIGNGVPSLLAQRVIESVLVAI